MRNGITVCALFILFSGLYLSSDWWAKPFARWVPWRPLRYALCFALVHTMVVLILVWRGGFLHSGPGGLEMLVLIADSPVMLLNAIASYYRREVWSPVPVIFLFGGLQWFLLGLFCASAGWFVHAIRARTGCHEVNLKRTEH